jgi:subfamily B ATP-binding cassette protein MsbA
VGNPPILIFDEATSALDNISERMVQDAIDAAMLDRTVIIIAHRLSTVVSCDRIVVLEQGRVQCVGTHNELLQNCKHYQELHLHGDESE